MEFNVGDRVRVNDKAPISYTNYGLGGCTGVVREPFNGVGLVKIDLDNSPSAWHGDYLSSQPEFLDKALSNGFFVGDKVMVNSKSAIYAGSKGTVVDNDNGDIVSFIPDNSSRPIGLNKNKIELKGGENNVASESTQVFHCFFIKNNGAEFDKLGDFNLTPSNVNNYLYDKYGEGSYLYKQKNEKTGKIVTLKAPDTPKCEVVEGIQS